MKTIMIVVAIWMILGIRASFGAWAAHAVLSPATNEQYPKYAPHVSLTGNGVIVRLPGYVVTHKWKSCYLVIMKERLSPDQMNLRPVLRAWWRHMRIGELDRQVSDESQERIQRAKNILKDKLIDAIDTIQPIENTPMEQEQWVEVKLDMDIARRGYIVWDHRVIYEKGAFVCDGGLWITYDLPAYIESLGVK